MPTRKAWETKIQKALVGKQIVGARYTTPEENENLGWYESGIVLFLGDGTYLIASQDDEGNGPGAIFTSLEDLPTLPVMGA